MILPKSCWVLNGCNPVQDLAVLAPSNRKVANVPAWLQPSLRPLFVSRKSRSPKHLAGMGDCPGTKYLNIYCNETMQRSLCKVLVETYALK